MVCIATLAGCSGPKISVTDISPRRVGFLVQNPWLVPMQDVDEQAASHCRQHNLTYRRTDVVWIGSALKRVAYECEGVERPLVRKPQVRRAAIAKPASEDPKAAAWMKAKAAIDAWALCLRFDAARKAKETTEAARSIVREVLVACSGLEHAVHEPLEAIGEDLSRFQADLHAQAVQNAAHTITSVRIKTNVPVSEPPAF